MDQCDVPPSARPTRSPDRLHGVRIERPTTQGAQQRREPRRFGRDARRRARACTTMCSSSRDGSRRSATRHAAYGPDGAADRAGGRRHAGGVRAPLRRRWRPERTPAETPDRSTVRRAQAAQHVRSTGRCPSRSAVSTTTRAGDPVPERRGRRLRVALPARRHPIAFVPEACVTHRAWRAGSDYLPLRWAYGYGRGAFYVKHMTAGDRAMLSSLLARRRSREGDGSLGACVPMGGARSATPLYLTANIVGGLHWLGRTWRDRRVRYIAGTTAPPSSGPTIPPVPDEADRTRPTWSVMIPTYNCAPYPRAHAALSARPRSVIEPTSRSKSSTTARRATTPRPSYARSDDRRLAFFRQPHNVGHVANFNTCLARVDAAGSCTCCTATTWCGQASTTRWSWRIRDHPRDRCRVQSLPVRRRGDHLLSTYKSVRDEPGVLDGWLDEIATGNRLQVVCMTVRRDVYETVGGFDSRIPSYGEDWEMWVRIAARYPVYFDPEPRAVYRLRDSSLTHTATPTRNVEQLRLVAELNRAVLPGETVARRSPVAPTSTPPRHRCDARCGRSTPAIDRQRWPILAPRSAGRSTCPIWGRLAEAVARDHVQIGTARTASRRRAVNTRLRRSPPAW